MTSKNPRGPRSSGVSALLALVLATIGFFALVIFGLGAVTVVTGRDIIAVPGLGQAPGATAMVLAVATFAGSLWASVRRPHPSFLSTFTISLGTGLAHLLVLWAAVLIGTGDIVIATVVAGDLIRGGASVVVLAASAIAGWCGIALRRTRAQQPRWPWERDDEE